MKREGAGCRPSARDGLPVSVGNGVFSRGLVVGDVALSSFVACSLTEAIISMVGEVAMSCGETLGLGC